MSELQIRFSPLDTLFFRDGSPFNRGELQANVGTIFPPSPTTLAGAIRALWARAMGWDGNGRGGNWDICCKNELGSGFTLPDAIRFNGPYLFYNNAPVFPAPAHLLGCIPDNPLKDVPTKLILLTPGEAIQTDMGLFRAPVKPASADDDGNNRKSLISAYWITVAGMQDIMQGEIPREDTLIHQSELWQIEQRIGNYREKDRVTGENALYAPRHIRLCDGVELAMFTRGLPRLNDTQLAKIVSRPALTGGEARSCWITVEEGSMEKYLTPSKTTTAQKYTCIALTPVQLGEMPKPKTAILEGTLVSSCNQRPLMLGGWDREKPRELVPCLPPGTTFFLESGTPKNIGKIQSYGAASEWGFGRFVTGLWK